MMCVKYSFFLCLFSVLSCGHIKDNSVQSNLKSQIQNVLKNIDVNSKVEALIREDTLTVELYIEKPKFLQDDAYKVLVLISCHELYNNIKDFNSVNFNITLEGFENEEIKVGLSQVIIYDNYDLFEKRSKLHEAIKYVFKNMTQDDVHRIDLVLAAVSDAHPDRFKFKGTFWNFLDEYFASCYGVSSSVSKGEFQLFHRIIKIEGSGINPEHFERLENICENQ